MKLIAVKPPPYPFKPHVVMDEYGNPADIAVVVDLDADDRAMLCRLARDARDSCAPWERFAIDRLLDLLGK